VLDDEEAHERADSVERLILCSGKVYTELVGSDLREEAVDTAVARIELLYPFPEERVREVIEGYPNLHEILWVQEEPKNMGAWTFVEPRLQALTDGEFPVRYVGKPARPSPAQGSARFHKEEHAMGPWRRPRRPRRGRRAAPPARAIEAPGGDLKERGVSRWRLRYTSRSSGSR
jgi:2-oxoglutarate dehydrogenase E1 component